MCKVCDDNGTLFHQNMVYACSCEKGDRAPKFFPSDRKKLRPYHLPVYGQPTVAQSNVKPFDPEVVKTVPLPYKDD